MNRQPSIREQQEAMVLHLVRTYQPISRAGIRLRSGIRLGTVGNIVRSLVHEGLLLEVRLPSPNRRGRRRGVLLVNPSGRLAVGVELGRERVYGVVTDVDGKVLTRATGTVKRGAQSAVLRAAVEQVIENLLSAAPQGVKVAGIGFVDPGIVDPQSGTSLYSTLFPRWRDVPISPALSERFGVPVHLSNTAQAKAVAEHLFGAARQRSDFIFIEFGDGLACGIYSGGRLITGADMRAGEFGHTRIPGRDERCACGGRGCLEAIASLSAITRRVCAVAEADCFRRPGDTRGAIDLPAVFRAYECGDRALGQVLDEIAGYLGLGIANLVNILNPSLVIFDGRLRQTGELFLRRIEEHVHAGILKGGQQHLEIAVSLLGEENGAMGGAGLVIEDVFALPEYGVL